MPDYPTDATQASTPAQPDFPDMPEALRPDPAEVARLLEALDAIPRTELPDGKARDVLAYQIHMGHVDNLYRPHMADYWNISWGDLPAWMDPRQSIAEWVEVIEHATSATQSGQGGEAQ